MTICLNVMMVMPHINMMVMPHINMMVMPHINMMVMPHINMMVMPHINMMVMPHINMMVMPLYMVNGKMANPQFFFYLFSVIQSLYYNVIYSDDQNEKNSLDSTHNCSVWSVVLT